MLVCHHRGCCGPYVEHEAAARQLSRGRGARRQRAGRGGRAGQPRRAGQPAGRGRAGRPRRRRAAAAARCGSVKQPGRDKAWALVGGLLAAQAAAASPRPPNALEGHTACIPGHGLASLVSMWLLFQGLPTALHPPGTAIRVWQARRMALVEAWLSCRRPSVCWRAALKGTPIKQRQDAGTVPCMHRSRRSFQRQHWL